MAKSKSEIQPDFKKNSKKLTVVKRIFPVLAFLLNSSAFISLSIIANRILWEFFGKSYIWSEPVGSDYFNALTYLNHFAKYLTHPAASWLPFWNEGSPAIGGYPFLSFYLTLPLVAEYPMTVALNLLSYGSLLLFFIACLLLFWQVSKNWLISAGFTLSLMATKATYYQLTTGAFITSASVQWYLPMVLFLLYRFVEKYRLPYITAASLLSGLALLHHGPTSFLMVFLPSMIILIILFLNPRVPRASVLADVTDEKTSSDPDRGNPDPPRSGRMSLFRLPKKTRLLYLALFIVVSLLIGAISLYTLFLQTFLGSGTGECASRECWGEYPKHLIVWLTPTSVIVAVVFFVLAIIFKLINRKINLLLVLPAFSGFLFFVAYALAAYLKLIDGLSNVIFPTRIFWAANLFMLLIAASFFASIRRVFSLHSLLIAALTFSIITLIVITKPVQIHKDFNATIPSDIVLYTIPQFATKPLSELVPDWLTMRDTNWRIDIFNSGLYHWWNFISEVPATRGYSNHPLGVHQDWLFLLQDATRDVDPSLDLELVTNRALFLFDAFGVKYLENSQAVLPAAITKDSNLIANYSKLRDFEWYELKKTLTTPIVSPTNSPPVLFIGDSKAYESFIRTLAMINLNSKILIPVRGPQSLNEITKEELEFFPALFLYQYSGSNYNKLLEYVKKGGHVFIETGTQKSPPKEKLPEIFPAAEQESKSVQQSRLEIAPGTSIDVDSSQFSPLSYKNDPWRINAAKSIRDWAQPILLTGGQPILAKGSLGEGSVIWSGFNFLFHIVDNNNFEEAKLFKSLLTSLLTQPTDQPSFKISREKPERIRITAQNTNGIYFKENYHSGWKAKINDQPAKIYKAGLEFMYVPQAQGDVTLEFKGNRTTWGLYYLTVISTVASVIYLVLAKPINLVLSRLFQKLRNVWSSKLNKKIKKWVDEE